MITIEECKDLHKEFLRFADSVGQPHTFFQLFQIDSIISGSIDKWEKNGVDQDEAANMFRVVNKIMGKEE